MKLSLVTGTVNRHESFARLVRSIVEHTTVDWELVVSDASDTPVESTDYRVRLLPEKPRLGCVKGYNRAFRAALGEWVLYLNDDAEVTPNYDVAAISFMEAHPKIGIGALHYSEPENGKDFHYNGAWGVPYANFGILKRELGDKIGWFDEALVMYGNDNSLTLRILLQDLGISDIPDARILHWPQKDALRAENQKTRMRDTETLAAAYMPLRRYWLDSYSKHRVPGHTEAWPHGQEPDKKPPQEVVALMKSKGLNWGDI